MKKHLFPLVLLCLAVAGLADAGQFRIAPPSNLRKRQPPPNYRESRLEIVNRDNRGYAIDVDYRRNRLELASRNSGDIFIPANSSITLVFDDDDNWRINGDNESLEIEIRSGRTTTLRLETRMDRNRIGLFGTVDDGRRQQSKQLFGYAERPGPGRPNGNHQPAPAPAPARPQPHAPQPSHPAPQPSHPAPQPQPQHGGREPSRGSSLGQAVGNIIDNLVDKDDHSGPRR